MVGRVQVALAQDIFFARIQAWRFSVGSSHPHFAIKDGGRGFENEVSGACAQPSKELDRFFSTELSNKLFANPRVLGKARGVSSFFANGGEREGGGEEKRLKGKKPSNF